MSVITSTEKDVSVRIPLYTQDDTEMPVSERRPARTNPLAVVQQIMSYAPPLALGVLLLISWYVATVFGHVNGLILPVPGDVFSSLSEGLRSGLFLSRSEEHTSELQSLTNLVCRLLLEKKKK